MIRLLLRLLLLMMIVCALPVLLIRAQAYEDHDLRAFLTPPADCPAPCFMSIRPGVTTAQDAVAVLEANPWIKTINFDSDYPQDQIIWWEWGPTPPDFIDPGVWGRMDVRDGRAARVRVGLKAPYGDVALIVSMPDKHVLADADGNHVCEYQALYKNFFMTLDFNNTINRPVTPRSLWQARKMTVWVDEAESDEHFFERFSSLPDYSLPGMYRATSRCTL